MAIEANLDEIVAACRDTLAARTDTETAAAVLRRQDAIWRLVHTDGLPAPEVTYRAIQRLLGVGYTVEQIAKFGLSSRAVQTAVQRPGPDGPQQGPAAHV